MKLRNQLILVVLAVLVASILAACGGSKSIDAALTSYKITLSDSSASSGDVTFHIHNDATDGLTHEFVVFKTDLPADQLPLNEEGIVDEEAAGITLIDEAEEIEPGSSTDLTVNLDPGNYVLVCNLDSDEMHYQHGMHTPFTVN